MDTLLEAINNWDSQLILWVNGLHTSFLDSFMYLYSGRFIWIPFYIFLAYLLLRKYGWRKMIVLAIAITLMIVVTDQLCSSVLKGMICRPRPAYSDIGGMLHFVNDYRGGAFGFPSNHAANTAALAVFVSMLYRKAWMTWMLVGWALLMGYSRMYLGVHYPTDLIAGYAIGALFGFITAKLTLKYLNN